MSESIKIVVELERKDLSTGVSPKFLSSLIDLLGEKAQGLADLWCKGTFANINVYQLDRPESQEQFHPQALPPQAGSYYHPQQAPSSNIPPPPPQIPQSAQSRGPSAYHQDQPSLNSPPVLDKSSSQIGSPSPSRSMKRKRQDSPSFDLSSDAPQASERAGPKPSPVPIRSRPSVSNNYKYVEEEEEEERDYNDDTKVENKLVLCALFYLIRVNQSKESFTLPEIEDGERRVKNVFQEIRFAGRQIPLERYIAYGDVIELGGKYLLTKKGKDRAENVGIQCAEIESAGREANEEAANESPRKAPKLD